MIKAIRSILGPRPVDLDDPDLFYLTGVPEVDLALDKIHGPRTPLYLYIQLILWRFAMDQANMIQFWPDAHNGVVRIVVYFPGVGISGDREYWRQLERGAKWQKFGSRESSDQNDPDSNARMVNSHFRNLSEQKPMSIELLPDLIAEFRWIARLPRPFSKGGIALQFGGTVRRPRLKIRENEVLVSYADQQPLSCDVLRNLFRDCSCHAIVWRDLRN
jgi:hypothetical protein